MSYPTNTPRYKYRFKLAREIGGAKAAKELGIPEGTIHTWLKAVREDFSIGDGAHTRELQ